MRVTQKCTYLKLCLEEALDQFPNECDIKWDNCCQNAINKIRVCPQPLPHISNSRILQKWFVNFRDNGNKLIVPSMMNETSKQLPPFLERYPDLKDAIIEFAYNNIGVLFVDLLHEYLN